MMRQYSEPARSTQWNINRWTTTEVCRQNWKIATGKLRLENCDWKIATGKIAGKMDWKIWKNWKTGKMAGKIGWKNWKNWKNWLEKLAGKNWKMELEKLEKLDWKKLETPEKLENGAIEALGG
jgi:hypothetical protein